MAFCVPSSLLRPKLFPSHQFSDICLIPERSRTHVAHSVSKAQTNPRVTSMAVPSLPKFSVPFKAFAVAAAAFLFSSEPHIVHEATADVLHPVSLNAVPHHFASPQILDSDSTLSTLRARWEVHSVDSQTETLLVFSNDSASVVDLWWVDYCGREVYYASINPGTTHMQPSFASHPWVVREHLSQNPVLVLVATTHPLLAVVKSI